MVKTFGPLEYPSGHARYGEEHPQMTFLKSSADIALFGGTRGPGKTYAQIFDPLRYTRIPDFNAVIFRRTWGEIVMGGGPWETAESMYPWAGAKATGSSWHFPSGARIEFSHMHEKKDWEKWLGAQIPYMGFDQLETFCLTPDHEVLTNRGWIFISEVKQDDAVLSCEPDGTSKFRKLKSVERFNHVGKMVEIFQTKGVSFIVTPNHRVLIQRQDPQESLGFVTADRLLRTIQVIPRVRRLNRKDFLSPIVLPKPKGRGVCDHRTNWAKEIPVDDYLEFLGWYLAEGCSYANPSPMVMVCQMERKESLDKLFERLPFDYRWSKRADHCGIYRICSRQLFDHLKPMGSLYQKRVPRWIYEKCSARQMKILLDAFIDGDGHRNRTGGSTIGIANEGLRDDMQELCCLVGLVSTAAHSVITKPQGLAKNGSCRPTEVFRLTISKETRQDSMTKPERCREVEYAGKVFCLCVEAPPLRDFTNCGEKPSVPGGNFLIRHRGRVCFTGNTEHQFISMLASNRDPKGICRPLIRATANPQPGWLADFIQWWWDPATDYPIMERGGKIRWFIRKGDAYKWADSAEQLKRDYPGSFPKSFTFIPAFTDDNTVLMANDPSYMGNLMAQDAVTQERWLRGNWKVKPAAGMIFNRSWWNPPGKKSQIIELSELPVAMDAIRWVRSWDIASTAAPADGSGGDPDWTAGVLMGMYAGQFYVKDVRRFRRSSKETEDGIRETAGLDGINVVIRMDEGANEKTVVSHYQRNILVGYNFQGLPTQGRNKVLRAGPYASAVQAGNVFLIRGEWNADYIDELDGFQGLTEKNDMVDSSTCSFTELTRPSGCWDEESLKMSFVQDQGQRSGTVTIHETENGMRVPHFTPKRL